MRLAIVSKGLALAEIQAECLRLGAKNIKVAKASGQVFCDLEEAAVQRLRQVPGLAVKAVGKVYTEQFAPPQAPPVGAAIYATSQVGLASLFYQAREMMEPPLLGLGQTVCILDSGIRKTHRSLEGKVVYEANFTDSATAGDVFDHGTGVAFLVAGGRHARGEEAGLAPRAAIMNIKVLNDAGEGTAESVVMGVEEVIRLREEGFEKGLVEEDPMVPSILNLSFGAPDDGDPDNPIRVACRRATASNLGVIAAAGNAGPAPQTIMVPAADPDVFAVGALTLVPFEIWERSSRGPTLEGLTKPDLVFYGVDILVASAKSDTAFEVKAGTSFASPLICGGAALIQEGVIRLIGRRLWPKEYFALLPFITRKPEGVPLGLDNTYGWGMPFGDLVAQRMAPAAPGLEAAVPLVGLGLAMPLMAGMMKAVRKER